jgi:L-ribulokinase
MCGAVDGGIIAGMWGFEAGQSGVGDIFGWWVDSTGRTHEELSELAGRQHVGEHGLVALDWESGNRSVLVDGGLSGVIVGLTLATKPEDVYRAIVEATAFGTRKIVNTFEESGVPVREFIAGGGLVKNQFVMQIYADVLNRPISVVDTGQAPALGSAIHAATAAGEYSDVPAAAAVMGKVRRGVFAPDADRARRYDPLYAEYDQLHDYFGRGTNDVLHRLRAIRNTAHEGDHS